MFKLASISKKEKKKKEAQDVLLCGITTGIFRNRAAPKG